MSKFEEIVEETLNENINEKSIKDIFQKIDKMIGKKSDFFKSLDDKGGTITQEAYYDLLEELYNVEHGFIKDLK